MDFEEITYRFLTICMIISVTFCCIYVPGTFRAKDMNKKELLLNCNNDLQCMELILGKDSKYGY